MSNTNPITYPAGERLAVSFDDVCFIAAGELADYGRPRLPGEKRT